LYAGLQIRNVGCVEFPPRFLLPGLTTYCSGFASKC